MGIKEQVRQICIKKYLESRDIEFNEDDFCSSPFSKDSNWSFKYYEDTNSFFDWSKGYGGDIIDLVRRLYKCGFYQAIDLLQPFLTDRYLCSPSNTANKKVEGRFDFTKYINENEEEVAETVNYGKSRGIHTGYYAGVFYTREEDGSWVKHPSMMYVHVDEGLEPCGVKFRKVRATGDEIRFSARGKQGMYILENRIRSWEPPILYLVESESSANSLWEYARETDRNIVVISFGSVSAKIRVPDKYADVTDRRLIIDYDGSDELYQERLNHFELDGVKPVKMKLPKGEDINSLYSHRQLYLYDNVIFNR